MEGVNVVELGFWVAGPAAGGILAVWGADVIKIEPADGDPLRGFVLATGASDIFPPFGLDNRGKRGICLDLSTGRGKEMNPIVTSYQAGDGKWFWLLCLQGDRQHPTSEHRENVFHLGHGYRSAS